MNRHDDVTTASAPEAAAGTGARDSSQAARLLEAAANNADQLVAEATAEAAALVQKAHSEANDVTTAARAEADQLVMAAKMEAARVRSELEQTRSQHDAEISRLQGLESDHKDRMRSHLTGLLSQIDGNPDQS